MKLLKEHIQLLINETINDVLLEQKGGSIIDALQKASNDFIDFSKMYQEVPTKEEIDKHIKKITTYKDHSEQIRDYRERDYWEKEIQNYLKYYELYDEYPNEQDMPLNLYDALDRVAKNYKLKEISHGSSRTAYELPTQSYILKIARNEKGIVQNEHEVEIYTNPQIKDVVPRIYPKSDLHNYSYLIVEKVNPISSYEDFKEIKKYNFSIVSFVADRPDTWEDMLKKMFVTVVNYKMGTNFTLDYICSPEFANKYNSQYNVLSIYRQATIRDCCMAFKDAKWLNEIGELVHYGSLSTGDIYPEHFGTTSSGRVVIYDTGLSKEIYATHYSGF